MILRLALVALLLAAGPVAAAAPPGPAVGSWATYRWTSSVRQDVPVLVRQEGPGGQVTWSVAQESAEPAPLFVTYAVVRGDARSYTLQVVTQQRLDGPPLSVTQVQVDRASGKVLKSVIRAPKGPVSTPVGTLLPFQPADVKGTEETVTVPAGQLAAVRAPYQDGTVWVSDRVPALGLVKATFPSGTLELVRSGAGGAKDLLRS
jgi:hypothetical protein